jgi:hypothetical protein
LDVVGTGAAGFGLVALVAYSCGEDAVASVLTARAGRRGRRLLDIGMRRL